jgi:hypothetical protein
MELAELKQAVPGLADKSHYDKIKIFGWWLHVHKPQATFVGADIAKCYDALHFAKPSSFSAYIGQLADKKELLKSNGGYRLENKIREQLDADGIPEITVKVTSMLTDLAASIPNVGARAYYQEALICYKVRLAPGRGRHDLEHRLLAPVRPRAGETPRRLQRSVDGVVPRYAQEQNTGHCRVR